MGNVLGTAGVATEIDGLIPTYRLARLSCDPRLS